MNFNKLGWVRGKGKPLTHPLLLNCRIALSPQAAGRGRNNEHRICLPRT
jgi:hypothetical protein